MARGGVIAAIVLVVLGAASATPWVFTVPPFLTGSRDRPVPTLAPVSAPPQQPSERDLPAAETFEKTMIVVLAVIAVATITFVVLLLVRRLRAAWRPEEEDAGVDRLEDAGIPGGVVGVDVAALATAVARAEAHLAGSRVSGDAVIAAWVALEDEAERQGAGRAPAQTATEFTTELLARTAAPADAVATLRGLYHRARFTSRAITAGDVDRARDALTRIARAIDASGAEGHRAAGVSS